MLLLFSAFHLPAFSGQRLAAVAALLWGFAPAGLCLTYMLQMAFEVRRGAGPGVACSTGSAVQLPSVQAAASAMQHSSQCECGPATHRLAHYICVHWWASMQDEVRVLVRCNTIYFTSGYLGHLAVWILDTIHRCVRVLGQLSWGSIACSGTAAAFWRWCMLDTIHRCESSAGLVSWPARSGPPLGGLVAAGRGAVVCAAGPLSCTPHQPRSHTRHPFRRLLPSAPGVERARRLLRLVLQALSPHFCLARGVHLVRMRCVLVSAGSALCTGVCGCFGQSMPGQCTSTFCWLRLSLATPAAGWADVPARPSGGAPQHRPFSGRPAGQREQQQQ